MKVGIYVNINRDIRCVTANKLIDIFCKKGIQVFVASGAEEYIKMPSLPLKEVAQKADILICFGGDGTLLSVASKVVKNDIALLGVNKGRLGFLTECEDNDLQVLADKLINGDYELDERTMLKVMTSSGEYLALNEVSLSRLMSKRTIDISIEIDGDLCDIVSGDGVIVSTPTGSTAYAMSCGGAILSPDVKAIGITAICPHSLNSRPMVVNDESKICLKVKNTQHEEIVMCIDGQCVTTDKDEIIVNVEKSEYNTKLIRFENKNFYNKLIQKMSVWNKFGGSREI